MKEKGRGCENWNIYQSREKEEKDVFLEVCECIWGVVLVISWDPLAKGCHTAQ